MGKEALKTKEGKPLIGRKEYAVVEGVSSPTLSHYSQLGKSVLPHSSGIEFKMHNNSNNSASYRELGKRRPASAYFTLLNGILIIEWGEIDPKGTAKLHDYLNREIDYLERVQNGGTVRSGHIGYFTIPEIETELRFALFDSLTGVVKLEDNRPENKMVSTLLNNGFMPVTSDGLPLALTEDLENFLAKTIAEEQSKRQSFLKYLS